MTTSTLTCSNNKENNVEDFHSKSSKLEIDGDSKQINSSTKTISFPLPLETEKPSKILECDKKTADAHVPRDSRLIRLTGVHPFNCEAPLSVLYDSGFLTPTELWYVRNHGAVPEVLDSDILNWEFRVEGMVEKPITLKLAELLTFNQITIPITMVCAGNRRKEQNVIRKGNGFNWGSAGVSTALFTGVLINEVIKLAQPKHTAKYMCMEGADKLPNGYYGTSIRLSTAMNTAMGVILAHKMNGESLAPDHGRPLRIVVPGQIGGRSVKWLKRIIITEEPSDNWYHIYDNRVLPTMVTPEIADENKSWYNDERYALYNLNVQSVICYPAHEEIVKIEENKSYNIRGYAYNGGGIRIGRVEISLDQGHTWQLAKIDYPEDLYRKAIHAPQLFGGKLDMPNRELCFCWCFWNIEVPIMKLSQAKDIVVRAMDENMNIQPRDMYWNVLSMLNNCWHRLTVTKQENSNVLKFNHPTVPALTKGGWMEKVKEEGRELTDGFWGSGSVAATGHLQERKLSTIKMFDESITREITEEELSKHNKDGDAWIAVNEHVYDVSKYLKDHPGGVDSIVLASGMDATDDFMTIHSDHAKSMLIKYQIGILKTNTTKKNNQIDEINANTQRDIFLSHKQWTKATLKRKTEVNHDSVYLTFGLEHSNQKLGVPIGKYFYMRCTSQSNEKVIRSYTPISETDQLGEFDLVIKLYRASDKRSAGKMSACIDLLKEGDTVECKGPFGDFEYQGNGTILNKGATHKIEKLTIIAGGSGITGIYQIFRQACRDGIECELIYCNKTEKDILMRKELDSLQHVHYCLTRQRDDWTGLRGYISSSYFKHVHDGLLLCCGPPEMMDNIYKTAVKAGWNVNEQFIRF
ncbi:unnamed protein product [Adineta steineri]|uniref:Nitrate reductase n=1 Tax=Adineta steineri TaxID=433720 RepID=A0A813YAE5_9BILA|nr:unnamed protein product [Adineta steineri]CAF3500208.1 unnamed protein product [Adineta steineri]